MTVRFNTWVEAQNVKEAWDKLWEKLRGGNMGEKLERVFTVAVLEDPEEDKRELAPLTVKELRDCFYKYYQYEGCSTDCPYCSWIEDDLWQCNLPGAVNSSYQEWSCPGRLYDDEIDELTKKVRGEKE